MPYLVQILSDNDDVEVYDDTSKSVRQVLDRLADRSGLTGCEIRVWTVTGPARSYSAEPAVRFEGTS